MGADEQTRRLQGSPLIVRVIPDVKGIEKRFDYLVPDSFRDQIRVGTIVRIRLHGRRVRGWVWALDVTPPDGVRLVEIERVVGWGPPTEIVELAEWAAWRWAGRAAHLLSTGSPETIVSALPRRSSPPSPVPVALDSYVDRAFQGVGSVVRLPPSHDPYDLALAACRRGNGLILVPSLGQVRLLGARLRRAGVSIGLYPRDWAAIAAGGSAIGTRSAAWAPMCDLAAVVVFDEHDEGHQQEQSPTWNARDVALERARRAGVPCVLVSPIPTLEALDALPLVLMSRGEERAGWPIIDVVDRTREDPAARTHALTPAVMRAVMSGRRVVCVTNTTGQARLLACGACSALARCERCKAAVSMVDDLLVCGRCALVRPPVCIECASSRLKLLRRGTARLRAELASAVGEEVVEVTARTGSEALADARVYVGTEAALRQVRDADVVAFLDFDGELLAPRYRAAEQSLALLALAARLVGGRSGGGRIIVQTSEPHHEVLDAVLHADPGRLVAGERARRAELQFPPSRALAVLSGAGALAFASGLVGVPGVEVLGPADQRWLVRARDHRALCDALASIERPEERLRIEVDPLRI